MQGGVLRHQVRRDLVGALRELRIAESLGATLHHRLDSRRGQALMASLLLAQDLLAQLIAQRDDVARYQPCVAEQVVLDCFIPVGVPPSRR